MTCVVITLPSVVTWPSMIYFVVTHDFLIAVLCLGGFLVGTSFSFSDAG